VGHLETGDLWLNSGIFILPENTYHQVKKNCFAETISENANGCSRREHDI
jgi:hypothetical protein